MSRNVKAKKIFALLGYMGVGKDTILKQVLKDMNDVKPIISTTTRPMRKGETEGVEYYFIDDTEFFRRGTDFVEQRIYHTKVKENGVEKDATWRYGIERMELEKDDYLIVIVDSVGYKELKNYVGNGRIVPIFISAPQEELRARALARGDLEAEVDRRLKDDYERFLPFRVGTVYDEVKNGEGRLEEAIKEVEGIITKHINEVKEIKCKTKRKK